MNKILFTLCLFFSISFCSQGQITWEKLFVRSNTDVFRSIQEVPAGGYIAAGYTSAWSSNDTDAYVVRMDVNGDTLWTRKFHEGRRELFYKVINTSDGGFALCGYKLAPAALATDAYYMKLDANGNVEWQGVYGGNGTERAQEIIQTADGGYAICGYSNSSTGAQQYNSYLLRLDASGGQVWNYKYGGNGFDDANSVKELPNGDFIMVGQTTSYGLGSGDVWLVRTNSAGTMLWDETFGSVAPDNAEHIQLATLGGFIICGSTQGMGVGGDEGYIIKTDDNGNLQWEKTFGGGIP